MSDFPQSEKVGSLTLDEKIAEALGNFRLKEHHESWGDFLDLQAAAVRSAVCDWLREDEGVVKAMHQAILDEAAESGSDYRWVVQAMSPGLAVTSRAALLSYMEGADRGEGTDG